MYKIISIPSSYTASLLESLKPGSIYISRTMTTKILPQQMKENNADYYKIINKGIRLAKKTIIYSKKEKTHYVVFDHVFKFHKHKLYFVAENLSSNASNTDKKKKYKNKPWRLLDELYDKQDIITTYNLDKFNENNFNIQLSKKDKIEFSIKQLKENNSFLKLVKKTKWQKIKIKRNIKFGVFLEAKYEIHQFKEMIRNAFNNHENSMKLIKGIRTGKNEHNYWYVNILIINIKDKKNTYDIGIEFNNHPKNKIKVMINNNLMSISEVYVAKKLIRKMHRIVPHNIKYKECLECSRINTFNEAYAHISIGRISIDNNLQKALRLIEADYALLKEKNQALLKENEELKNQNCMLNTKLNIFENPACTTINDSLFDENINTIYNDVNCDQYTINEQPSFNLEQEIYNEENLFDLYQNISCASTDAKIFRKPKNKKVLIKVKKTITEKNFTELFINDYENKKYNFTKSVQFLQYLKYAFLIQLKDNKVMSYKNESLFIADCHLINNDCHKSYLILTKAADSKNNDRNVTLNIISFLNAWGIMKDYSISNYDLPVSSKFKDFGQLDNFKNYIRVLDYKDLVFKRASGGRKKSNKQTISIDNASLKRVINKELKTQELIPVISVHNKHESLQYVFRSVLICRLTDFNISLGFSFAKGMKEVIYFTNKDQIFDQHLLTGMCKSYPGLRNFTDSHSLLKII
ncbi:MAG: hypothetical protein GY730_09700 [bacterium]|nr:hypothetical protein [bacterium]